MRKIIVSVLTVVSCFGLAALGAGAFAAEDPGPSNLRPATFFQEEQRVDLSAAPSFVQTTKPITIVASAPRRQARAAAPVSTVWRCGAPIKLENDATQTVRRCETR